MDASLTHSLTHSQALQPMQGLGRLKKSPPANSKHGQVRLRFTLPRFILSVFVISAFYRGRSSAPMDVGPCHHGMARPQVADGGMASYMEGSCE